MSLAALTDFYTVYLKGQYSTLPEPSVDLSGATVIVTGANAGLGKELAAKLAAMNASKVILAVRSLAKGETAQLDIIKANPKIDPSSIEVWLVDLADFKSVKAFAQRVEAHLSRIDIIVCNAGIANPKFELSSDGWESTLQVNGLSTFYLSLLLLPLLQKTARTYYPSATPNTLSKPHLTIVTSSLHYEAKLPVTPKHDILPALNAEESFEGIQRYMQTKLLEVLFVRSLSEQVERTAPGSVLINSVNPGFYHSNLNDTANKASIVHRIFMGIMKSLLARSSESGARALAWAAISDVHQGSYSSDCAEARTSRFVTSPEGVIVQERLWKEVIDVLTKVDPSLADSITS